MVGITQTWPQLLNEFTPGNSGLCVDVGGGLVGEQHRLFGSDEDLESSGRFYYVYATADAAAKAYAKGIAGLSTCGPGLLTKFTISETATTADGSIWNRTWTYGPTNYFYVLRQGRVVEWAVFTSVHEDNAATDLSAVADRDFLATLEKKLTILTHS